MTEERVAFRLYGCFHWPAFEASGIEGCFEIFFRLEEGGWITCVEWRPGLGGQASRRIGDRPSELADQKDDQRKSIEQGNPFIVSLAKPADKPLTIRGAILFEQIGKAREADAEASHLRWLLARRFAYGLSKPGEDRIEHSSITLGSAAAFPETHGDAARSGTVEFQLALPAPAPQGVADRQPVSVFPFRVRIAGKHKGAPWGSRDDGLVPVDEIAAGIGLAPFGCDWVNQRPGPGGNQAKLASSVLGEFGFAPRSSIATEHYIIFPRAGDTNQKTKRAALWPTDFKTYRNLTLGKFAEGAGKISQANLIMPGEIDTSDPKTEPNESHESVWPSALDDSHRTRIHFRSALGALPTARKTCSDFAIKDGVFTPRTPVGSWKYLETTSAEEFGYHWTRLDLITEYGVDSAAIGDILTGRQLPQGWVLIRVPLPSTGAAVTKHRDLEDSSHAGTTIAFSDLLAHGLSAMRLPRLSLSATLAGDGGNAIPDALIVAPRNPVFALAADIPFVLDGAAEAPDTKAPAAVAWKNVRRNDVAWPHVEMGLRLWDYSEGRHLEKSPSVWPKLRFTLPGLDAQTPSRRAEFEAQLRPDLSVGDEGMARAMSFALDPSTDGNSFAGRLGGLALQASKAKIADPSGPDDRNMWRFRSQQIDEQRLDGDSGIFVAADTIFSLAIALDMVVPEAVDVPWGDRSRSTRPLLLPFRSKRNPGSPGAAEEIAAGGGAEGAAAAALTSARTAFALLLREEISLAGDRHFGARIFDQRGGGEEGAQQYVVLGAEPFSLTAVSIRPLAARGNDSRALVAEYSSDTRQWVFSLGNQSYHYRLPAQAAGESMDKPGQLEIVDPRPTEADPLAPFPERDPAPGNPAKEPAQLRRAVDFRLTAPAELWIKPSDLERQYLLPEWATHELFRQRGDFGIGTAFVGLRAEYVYGLSVSIDPSLEQGPPRAARVAEIETLYGRPVDPGERSLGSRPFAARYSALHRAIAHRPERLELWMPDSSYVGFEPARFSKGVRFALRDGAQLRSPFPDPEGASSRTPFNDPRLVANGLAGGVLWGIEARPYIKALLDRPNSSSGTIEHIALSPTGGDADLRAEFLDGSLAVIAETRGGRVQRQRVEILGRIGVFWNRAKHVVVYERTVNPSPQFTPEGGIGVRTRRPVLRKVEEYIELLEAERFFPDVGNTDPASAGFLHATRFNSKRIHVDSEWSENHGKTGWQIPLWNRHSAAKRPSVYPRPDVAFVMHAEGEEAMPLVAQECLDPDNLYFFSDAALPGPDTNLWRPVLGVDWTNLPPPCHEWENDLDDGEGGRQPSAVRCPVGNCRFTWRLAPASRRVRVNAGRAGKPIYVALETLTFRREGPVSEKFASFNEAMKEARGALKADAFAALSDAMTLFEASARGGDADTIRTAAEKLRGAGALENFRSVAEGAKLSEIGRVAAGATDHCKKMVDDLVVGLQRKQLLWMEHIREWRAEIRPADIATYADRNAWVLASTSAIMEAISPAADRVHADIGRVQNDVARAKAIVRDFENEVHGLHARALGALAEVRAVYDDSKPWSAARIEEYQRSLENARAGLLGDLLSLASEIRSRLSVELGGASTAITIAAGGLIERAIAGREGLATKLSAAESAALAALSRVREQVEEMGALIVGKLDEAIKSAPEESPANPPLKAARAKLIASLNLVGKTLEQLDRSIRDGRLGLTEISTSGLQALVNASQELKAALVDVLGNIDDAIAAGEGEFKAIIEAIRKNTEELPSVIESIALDVQQWALNSEDYYDRAEGRLKVVLEDFDNEVGKVFAKIDDAVIGVVDHLSTLSGQTSPTEIESFVKTEIVEAAFKRIVSDEDFKAMQKDINAAAAKLDAILDELLIGIDALNERAETKINEWTSAAAKACGDLNSGIGGLETKIRNLIDDATNGLKARLGKLLEAIDANKIEEAIEDAEKLLNLLSAAEKEFDQAADVAAQFRAASEAYVGRVFDSVGKVDDGGIEALPNNLLRLYAAAASAPALPNLDYTRERIAYYYSGLKSVIDTTPAEAWFGRLGTELKALGLGLPFSQIGERLIPADLSNFDIGRVFRKFGGLDLSNLFQGYKLPEGARDAIQLAHEFDRKQCRAWVQLDIDLPLPGRKSLFKVGPFTLDFVDSVLRATVRLEASKDSERVEQSGHASLVTTVDAVISGQSMVALQNLMLNFDRAGGLDIKLDPQNIKLNPAFEFIQKTLGSMFPEEAGGMKLIKHNGLPIGVEHIFAMPPINLMGGTTGVSNLSVSNEFSIVAFPDFLISNKFALARPDAPFLFTVFIIGGSGYASVECEYRPFTRDLAVNVEAAAGGSAALGFSLGPVSGGVSVSLSCALSYRKFIGRPGGGLTVAMVLVIAGSVDVAGIARVQMSLCLRMQYHENGQIDGIGTLSVSVRVSRFYTYRYRRNYEKKLRSGSSGSLLALARPAAPARPSRGQRIMEARA